MSTAPWKVGSWLLDTSAQTHLGGGRKHNYECFVLSPEHQYIALIAEAGSRTRESWPLLQQIADGVQRAFQESMQTQYSKLIPCEEQSHKDASCCGEARVRAAMVQANLAAFRYGQNVPPGGGMAEIALLHFCCERAWLSHIGLLRAYAWEKNQLHLLTPPSLPSNHNRQADSQPPLPRCLGMSRLFTCAVSSVPFFLQSRFLLCSHGLYATIPETTMAQVLSEQQDGVSACRRLVDIAWNTPYQRADISLSLTEVSAHLDPREKALASSWKPHLEMALFE
jgi:serine/threonine protein phosphatase PrpC